MTPGRRVAAGAGRRASRRIPVASVPLVVLLAAFAVPADPGGAGSGAQGGRVVPGLAYRVLDLATGRTLASAHPEILARPVAPGSIVKIATLVAALESGTITPTTAMACPGSITLGGRTIACAHPDFHRPLDPAEALAYSCNHYYATVAERLPRSAFNHALTSLGLDPVPASVPMAAAALGLDGVRASPDRLLEAVVRLAMPSNLAVSDRARAVVVRGLRLCAASGTASALGEAGFDALAKTGTAPMPGGGYEGLVVAVTPAAHPSRAVIVLAAGAAGRDAAAVAARLLAEQASEPLAAPPGLPPSPPTLAIGRANSHGYTIERIAVEDYVAGVVAAEAAPRAKPGALEALAIAARTYALGNLGRHGADGFDLCDLTHCQALGTPTVESRRAAEATAGQVLTYRGALATVFYTASCGGRGATPAEVWPRAKAVPYLVAREDPWCAALPAWTSDIDAADLVKALRAAGCRGSTLRDLRVTARGPSGRVTRLVLAGLTPGDLSGDELRLAVGRTLGWQLLKSAAFEVVRTGRGYRFTGRGSGHGVGLCLQGAAHMAEQGQSAGSILAEFFPGTEIRQARTAAQSRSIEIALPAGEQDARAAIEALVNRSLAALADRLGVMPPARVRLVFHPTAESYQRATGQPWWTAAVTDDQGEGIQLLPPSVLRRRGILDRTVRHELVHLMTRTRLAGRPLWVREGVAIVFSGERAGPAPRAGPVRPCPTDAELRRAGSADAWRDAYNRAGACVARALAAGTRWQDVR